MNKVLAVFDDTVPKNEIIQNIIGTKGFGDVIVKNRKLVQYYQEEIKKVYPLASLVVINTMFAFQELLQGLENDTLNEYKIIHFFSKFIITDAGTFGLTLKKLDFIEEPYCLIDTNKHVAGVMFHNFDSYRIFLQHILQEGNTITTFAEIEQKIPVRGILDISNIDNFICCITGNFDSRYFNNLKGDGYTLVKSSADKKKIRAEYTYYQLLPEDMKCWFVMPFNYKEDAQTASYTMQRLYMADLAVKWVHGSFEPEEFEALLDMYFYFFSHRHRKPVTEEDYWRTSDKLYVEKVQKRIADLKQFSSYDNIASMLAAGSEAGSIDALVHKYETLKKEIEIRNRYPMEAVIGHGDPCFSNALYSKSTRILKFIDPKGALTEEDMWTNPYYDIAKLSHSVCGLYDFFNNDLYEVKVDTDFHCKLIIDFDNSWYKKLFRQKVEQYGYDYWTVRLYEASLFLSMLPLHIDNPHKVFGFILNADNILQEIKENV